MPLKSQPKPLDFEAGTVPDPGAVAELIRDYAQPLLYADPAGPADMETMRTAMLLAMMCWNLPVYEATGSRLYAQGMRTLKAIYENVPSAVASTLRQLIDARQAQLADVPFLVIVEVIGTTPQNASIVAEARMPKPAASPRA